MPLPLIIGAASIVSAIYGAKKGYDGYQKHSEADEIVKSAQARYEIKKSAFDDQEKETTFALELLGKKELEIGESIGEFKTLAEKLLEQLNSKREDKLQINFPQHKLQKIENYSYTAIGVLGSAVGAGAAGAAAGFAVYGGVMALGVASTGTSISALSGAAATKAALAAIGGGSLSAGGWGMAGGRLILGGATLAPMLAIAGWAYDSHGKESLKNAHKANKEVNTTIEKLTKAIGQLSEIKEYSEKINYELTSIFYQFKKYFQDLKQINAFIEDLKGRGVNPQAEINKLGDEVILIINNGYALAEILVNLITTPIFKPKKIDGEIVCNEDGLIEMEKDADGSMILNDSALILALQDAKTQAENI